MIDQDEDEVFFGQLSSKECVKICDSSSVRQAPAIVAIQVQKTESARSSLEELSRQVQQIMMFNPENASTAASPAKQVFMKAINVFHLLFQKPQCSRLPQPQFKRTRESAPASKVPISSKAVETVPEVRPSEPRSMTQSLFVIKLLLMH